MKHLIRLFTGIFAMIVLTQCGATTSAGNMTVKGGVATATQATSGINPSSLKVKVYKVGFYSDTTCTTLVKAADVSGADYQDWMQSPTITQFALPDGTYPCIAIEMETLIKPTPAQTTDNNYCVAGTQFDQIVCGGGGSTSPVTLIDGTATTCNRTASARAALYLSTTGSTSNDGWIPSAPSKLLNPLVVAGEKSSTFTIGALGKIWESNENGSTTCGIQEPTWDFR